jgi:hypothetical protein
MAYRGALTALAIAVSSPAYAQHTALDALRVLEPVAQPGRPQYMVLPPVEYDRPYDGDLTIKMVPTVEQLHAECNSLNPNPHTLACAYRRVNSCVIYMVEDAVMRQRGWNTGILLRHEIGHCNGWAADHPGQRALPWPIIHVLPAAQRR